MRACHLYDASEVFPLTNINFVYKHSVALPYYYNLQLYSNTGVKKVSYNLILVARDKQELSYGILLPILCCIY